MHQILHELEIRAPIADVFDAVSTPEGLDVWWTLGASGQPAAGAEYRFYFGPGYDWNGVVRRVRPGTAIEWQITRADRDWQGTVVGLELEEAGDRVIVRFKHTGWGEANAHFRRTSTCWALYLRILKRFLEQDLYVPYARRGED